MASVACTPAQSAAGVLADYAPDRVLRYPDFFNDVFGPIMQPGSSGGFAGPCRIGNIATGLVEGPIEGVRFLLDPAGGDLAYLSTFMTDRAYLGGVQGFSVEDVRLFEARRFAAASGMRYAFEQANGIDDAYQSHYDVDAHAGRTCARETGMHAVRVEARGGNGTYGSLLAASIGGGRVRVRRIDGFAVDWPADTYALLVFEPDTDMSLHAAERMIAQLGDAAVSVARAPFLRTEDSGISGSIGSIDGGNDESYDFPASDRAQARHLGSGQPDALFFESTSPIDPDEARACFPSAHVVALPCVMPVPVTAARRPPLFSTVAEWRDVAEREGISFVQAAIEYEKAFSGWSDECIWERFDLIASILHRQVHALEERGYDAVPDTPDLPVYGRLWNEYRQRTRPAVDGLTQHIVDHALSTNAKVPGILIVPGPMGTGGGYLFSALDALREDRGIDQNRLVESLAVAAALGALAYTHSNASGESGCAGESGVCCAMASGGAAYLLGGDSHAVEHAASMALQGSIGLLCDPIPGGKEFPCLPRTVRAAVTAPLYADLALAGIDPLIPYHEALQAIDDHFRRTDPALLCGPACGFNRTPTAARCKQRVIDQMQGLLASD
jgi:L-serine dehydratase